VSLKVVASPDSDSHTLVATDTKWRFSSLVNILFELLPSHFLKNKATGQQQYLKTLEQIIQEADNRIVATKKKKRPEVGTNTL
jgi:hypothetical protein